MSTATKQTAMSKPRGFPNAVDFCLCASIATAFFMLRFCLIVIAIGHLNPDAAPGSHAFRYLIPGALGVSSFPLVLLAHVRSADQLLDSVGISANGLLIEAMNSLLWGCIGVGTYRLWTRFKRVRFAHNQTL